MIIKRMSATFGCLDHAQLTPADGLNVIYAPNEAGKSTWCAFLRAMFYGVPSRERDKKGRLADKNRYQPWSGAAMEGELELVWRGREITLRRFSKGGAPFGGFEAIYTGTGEPVPELDGQTCGQLLLGVGREVWERTAFLGQSPTLAISSTPELERRIAALLSSGQEDVSYSQTQSLLKKWQNARRYNKSGFIPELERQLNEQEARLACIQEANSRIAQALSQRLALERQRAALEAELAAHEALERAALNNRYCQALQQEQELRAALAALELEEAQFQCLPPRAALLDAQGRAQRLTSAEDEVLRARAEAERAEAAAAHAQMQTVDGRFAGLDASQALAQAQRDCNACRTLTRRGRLLRRGSLWLWLPILLGCVPLLFFSRFPAFLSVGVPAICSAALFFLLRGAASGQEAQAAALLTGYAAPDADGIAAAAEDYSRKLEEARLARREAQRAAADCLDRQARLEREQLELLHFVRTFSSESENTVACATAIDRALRLTDRLESVRSQLSVAAERCGDLRAQGAREERPGDNLPDAPVRTKQQTVSELKRLAAESAQIESAQDMAKGELRSLGDPAEAESRREHIAQQLARRRAEYDALSTALEALDKANASLQQRFAPELNRLAGQIMDALTGGRYVAVQLDRDFGASAKAAEDLLPRSTQLLSRGTADQTYLAVRLAVCRLCLPGDDPSPLVLDDALLAFDDERLRLALAYLNGLGRQILLFSCQRREAESGFGTVLPLQS